MRLRQKKSSPIYRVPVSFSQAPLLLPRNPLRDRHHWQGGEDAVAGIRHCQREVARPEFSTDDRELGRHELTPLGERGGTVELEIVS